MLATKYRPQTFSDMIGQEVLVTTIRNAIIQDRVANAFLLTGIRGVGKTTTARIIARALNCSTRITQQQTDPNHTDILSIEPCGACANCISIAQSRHPDVLEVDAASRTGVDDIRMLIENSQYMPSMANYKIYIIDEVHMLSKSAFNALLKTLEEPPAHVKFIFATTEIRKIPVTILSRCQRFDLKRITLDTLTAHLQQIANKENISAEPEALTLIAKGAEGSVRDSLSLLDQAIVHGNGTVTTLIVTNMMGISDKHQLMDLFEFVAKGDIQATLQRFTQLYYQGMDITQYFQDTLELIHLICKAKVAPTNQTPAALSTDQYQRILNLSQQLDLSYLTRCWQMIINGLEEIAKSPVDLIAGEMLLIKLTHMSLLPSPSKIIRQLQEAGLNEGIITHNPAAPIAVPAVTNSISQPIMPNHQGSTAHALHTEPQLLHITDEDTQHAPKNFEDLVALFKINHEPLLHSWLYNEVQLIKYQPGTLEVHLSDSLPSNFIQRISSCLQEWTQMRWMVVVSKNTGALSLHDQAKKRKEELKEYYSNHPQVSAIIKMFPGTIVSNVEELKSN